MTRTNPPLRLRSASLIGLLAVALPLLAGCEATEATTSARASGFLGDYSKLRTGVGNEAQFVYLNEKIKFDRYDSVHLESVTYWVASAEDADDLDAETRQRLTDRLFRALYDRLSKDYKMVDKPGPTVMRIRAAITEAEGARVVMNAITSIIPQLRLLSQLGDLSDDTALLVGETSVECEITDSTTNEVLAAGVDQRMGNKTLKTAFTKWGDVDRSFEFWADRMAQRFAKLKSGDMTPVVEE